MNWLQIHKESELLVDKLARECLTDEERRNYLIYGVLPENRWKDSINDEIYNHIKSCPVCRLKLRLVAQEETKIDKPLIWDRISEGVHESLENEEKRVIEKVKS